MDYKVLRPHLGDKPYLPGDVRSAKAAAVSHLVAKGVLKPADQDDAAGEGGQKAQTETGASGASQPSAPENKASEPPQNASQTAAATDPDAADKPKSKD
jgi:hypothetical protein